MFERYYYNFREEKCAPFFWGGCGGVVPFETLKECEDTCLASEGLTIKNLQSLNDLYAEISLEFPKGWENPEFQIEIDGRSVNARRVSGGYSETRRMASLLFFPGKPGAKQVSVIATNDSKVIRAAQSFNWKGKPVAVLLDYPGDRLLVTAKKKIRLITANIEHVTITFNGQRTDPEIVGQNATLFTFDPEWRPGLNTVSVEGKGTDGSSFNRNFTFTYSPPGITQGETMLLSFGIQGTKSGPFYSIAIEGDAIASGATRTAESSVLDNEGWVGSETNMVRELKAVKQGQAKVLIFEKPHFLQERRLIKEIMLTVIPAG
jgi:hypothetical protein